ncbi:RNA-binding cell elongation regulator Jag/EloR [Chloroflexota bacterium]
MEQKRDERRSVVASGKTVEVAIENGLAMLGVHRYEVDVQVLSEGSRGVLGFGAEDARVELAVKLPAEPEPEPLPEALPLPEVPMPALEEPVTDGLQSSPEQAGHEILVELLRLMGIQASVESRLSPELADEGQPPSTVLNITGADLGILIGRRGETLRALQYLVRLMVSHRMKKWTNLVVDVENYRERRRRALDSLANRVAEQVARTGRAQALEPMPAYERRLVHIALRKNPDVTTQSTGEGERRKVMVVPKQ